MGREEQTGTVTYRGLPMQQLVHSQKSGFCQMVGRVVL